MRIDPWAKSHSSLRSELEALTRADLQLLAEEVTRELSRRAFKCEEQDEIKKRNADVGKPRW